MDNTNSEDNGNASEKILGGFLLALEIIVYFIKSFILYIHGIYKLIYPPKEKSVSGELILITGTGHGIGKELAKQYGELGAEIICVDINKETNRETVELLKKSGIKAHNFICDVASREDVFEMAKKIEKEIGEVTILVNNAGIMPCKPFLSHEPEVVRKMFDINVFAHIWLLEAFLPSMIKKDRGHIVGISSVAGLLGSPNVAPYCASKFAVRGLMEGLAEEFRRKKSNIRFTTVYPFVTDTGLCKKPKIRFSNCMKILSPAETASYIISAQRKDYHEAGVPPYVFFTNAYARCLPRPCAHLLIDLLDSYLEPHD